MSKFIETSRDGDIRADSIVRVDVVFNRSASKGQWEVIVYTNEYDSEGYIISKHESEQAAKLAKADLRNSL